MPLVPLETCIKPIDVTRTEDALRLTLTEANRLPWRSDGSVWGLIYVDLPDYRLADWASYRVTGACSRDGSQSTGLKLVALVSGRLSRFLSTGDG